MSAIERAVQDAANVATASGVSGKNILQAPLLQYLPGPSIERSRSNLRIASTNLQAHKDILPKDLRQRYKGQHKDLFERTANLAAKKKKMSTIRSMVLIPEAINVERETEDLRDQVQQSSDYYCAEDEEEGPAPSIHTLGSTYELVEKAAAEALVAAEEAAQLACGLPSAPRLSPCREEEESVTVPLIAMGRNSDRSRDDRNHVIDMQARDIGSVA